MEELSDLPVRKRSSTECSLESPPAGANAKTTQRKKPPHRRRSSLDWQLVELTGSESFENNADLQELYFPFPRGQVMWLFRSDSDYENTSKLVQKATGKVAAAQMQDVIHSYEGGVWTRWIPFSDSDCFTLEIGSRRGDEEVQVVGGLWDVVLKKRLLLSVYWEGQSVPVKRATWWSKIPRTLGMGIDLVRGTESFAPLREEEALAAESAMLALYSSVDVNFLNSRLIPKDELARQKRSVPKAASYLAFGPLLSKVDIIDAIRDNCFLTDSLVPPSTAGLSNEEIVRLALSRPPPVPWPMSCSSSIDALEKSLEAGIAASKGLVGNLVGNKGVVRRGRAMEMAAMEEEVESMGVSSPNAVDHVVFVIHGIGEAFTKEHEGEYFATVVDAAGELRSFATNAGEKIEYFPISWVHAIHQKGSVAAQQLEGITLQNTPMLRNIANDVVSDILFYSDKLQSEKILRVVAEELNAVYTTFCVRHPQFQGTFSIVAHSLGTVIVHDLLQQQRAQVHESFESNQFQLNFPVSRVFNVGSPLGLFLAIRTTDVDRSYKYPTVNNVYNIFHEFDPIAYRMEPLVDLRFKGLEPAKIPRADNTTPAHAKLRTSFAAFVASASFLYDQASKLVSKKADNDESANDLDPVKQATNMGFGAFNNGLRIDFALTSSDADVLNPYLSAARAHFSYWSSEDFAAFLQNAISNDQG